VGHNFRFSCEAWRTHLPLSCTDECLGVCVRVCAGSSSNDSYGRFITTDRREDSIAKRNVNPVSNNTWMAWLGLRNSHVT
jgi:hypothetical protein